MNDNHFSDQFKAHLEALKPLGYEFNEDATMVKLPSGQKFVAANAFYDRIPEFHYTTDLHDEGGKVGDIYTIGANNHNGPSALLHFYQDDSYDGTQIDSYDDGTGKGVRHMAWTPKKGEHLVAPEDIGRMMDEAQRSNTPIERPGVIRHDHRLGDSWGVPPGPEGLPTHAYNRRTGNWEQVPD